MQYAIIFGYPKFNSTKLPVGTGHVVADNALVEQSEGENSEESQMDWTSVVDFPSC